MQYSNVFSGPDALKDYYNPDKNPPLPLVEIPEELNPFLQDGVHIYAKMMTFLPAHNVKALPALNMLQSDTVKHDTKTVVEYSSGSTVISMAVVSRILHGITDTRAYISNKTSEGKLRLLQLFGLDLQLFGGPSQPEPTDERGGIQRAKSNAQNDPSMVNLNQYENDRNWGAHVRWTGPQILSQLPNISVMCAGVGTAGTMTGISTYLKKQRPSIATVGVCTAPGDRVPGPRSRALLEPVEFPFRECIDVFEECTSPEAYTASLHLTRNGIVCGPSSGFNLVGLLKYIQTRKNQGTLEALRSQDGKIDCAFICCDLPYTYVDEYFTKCDPGVFVPIKNINLLSVDKYRYDEAWELDVDSPEFDSIASSEETLIVDLRAIGSEKPWRGGASVLHSPLESLSKVQQSPFHDSHLLERQWLELAQHFDRPTASPLLKIDDLTSHTVLLVCYGGDTARVASSILRSNGVTAFSVGGGSERWHRQVLVDSPMGSP